MSAVWAPVPEDEETTSGGGRGARLRPVARPTPRLSRAPFLLVLIGVFGLGMAGLLMLNTTLQNQAFSARALDRQAIQLAYTQTDLESQIDVLSAPPELARRASALGMRPNPYPALLELPSGEVIGDPQAVTGGEVPSMIVKTPAEVAAEKAAAKAAAKAKAAAVKAEAERQAKAKAKAEAAKAKAAKAKAAKAEAAKAKAAKAKAKAAKAKAKAAEKKPAEAEGQG